MGRTLRSDHLPFAMPSSKHALSQEWRFLTFMHWEVSVESLQPHIPSGLEIDLFDGKAYVGTIPFLMKNVRPRLLPAVPGISSFPEFNIRTYVTKNGKPGVLFLTLDAQSRITCYHAPRKYGLPYRYAKCEISEREDVYTWKSKRISDGVELLGYSKSKGELMSADKDSLEEFLFERYCLYTNHKDEIHMAYTQHNPWQYKLGEVEIAKNSLTESYNLGIDVLNPDYVHMSNGVHVHTWPIQAVRDDRAE